MSWEPTVGTLSDERLDEIDTVWLQPCGACDGGLAMECTHAEGDYRIPMSELRDHIDALTAQLERARSIAVALEQELAQRGAGRWPMRQYATVELPDEAVDKAGVE